MSAPKTPRPTEPIAASVMLRIVRSIALGVADWGLLGVLLGAALPLYLLTAVGVKRLRPR